MFENWSPELSLWDVSNSLLLNVHCGTVQLILETRKTKIALKQKFVDLEDLDLWIFVEHVQYIVIVTIIVYVWQYSDSVTLCLYQLLVGSFYIFQLVGSVYMFMCSLPGIW